MSVRKPSQRTLRSLCGEIGPEDGVDPRDWFRGRNARPNAKRKTLQLCDQVAETLTEVLASDARDDVLRNLQVVAVVPAPDLSRLMVTVLVDPVVEGVTPALVLERLGQASSRLRGEVAISITRRRVPVLAYQVLVLGSSGAP